MILSLKVCSQNTSKGRFVDNNSLSLIAKDLMICDSLRVSYNNLRVESVIHANKSLNSLKEIEQYQEQKKELELTIEEYKKQNDKLKKPKSWVWKILLGVAGGYVLNDALN